MEVIKVSSEKINTRDLLHAAEIINRGGLVIFPTETVYGIGVDVFNSEAVKKVFLIKGRNFNNPLTLHLADKGRIKEVVEEIPGIAEKIIDEFLPGPLTVILRKNNKIPDIVTAGGKTIGIRVPDHKVAKKFLSDSKTFVAGTSANFSGERSPKSIKEIPERLLEMVDFILDSGSTNLGVHSTVIDFTQDIPKILRQGSFSKEKLESIIRGKNIG